MTTEETRKSSESPSTSPPLPTSFSSLPYDLALNCLVRISRFYRPKLSLVSKSFRSLVTSPDLDATRSHIGKTENCIYVCLDLNPNTRWFALAPIPKQQKLIPIPSFPYQYPESAAVVSIGAEIYIIGGFVKGKRSRRVLILDCRSHEWRRLPKLRVPRKDAVADVIDGKIYVTGGCRYNNIENWGEFYDPEIQNWEPLSPETLYLTIQKRDDCLVEIEKNVWCQFEISQGNLMWCDPKKDIQWDVWRRVKGLEELSPNRYFPRHLTSVTNSGGRGKVIVWWKSAVSHRNGPKIWCAEVSFERRGLEEIRGFVKNVFTLGEFDSPSNFLLHSAIVTL